MKLQRTVVDSKEKDATILAAFPVEAQRHLADPANPRRSYDFHTTTLCDQVIKSERKTVMDALGSWQQRDPDGRSRLDRQVECVDLLIIEGPWPKYTPPGMDKTKFRRNLSSLRKHLGRLNIEKLPVHYTLDAKDTIEFLHYLERRKEPLVFRGGARVD